MIRKGLATSSHNSAAHAIDSVLTCYTLSSHVYSIAAVVIMSLERLVSTTYASTSHVA
jgi:hypothetical protein